MADRSVILNLKDAYLVGKYDYRGEHSRADGECWVSLEQTLEREANISCEPITSTQLLCVDILIHVVIQYGTNHEKDSQEHANKDEIAHKIVDFDIITLISIDKLES